MSEDEYVPYETFRKVIYNTQDQVLVRSLINEHVPSEVKRKIRDEFNSSMKRRHDLKKDRGRVR